MKVLILTITFLLFIHYNTTFTQEMKFPVNTDLFQYAVPAGTKYGPNNPYGSIYGFPNFRLWGWSKDSKIAYSIESTVEGRGGTRIAYFIQDLITDKIIWKALDDSFNWDGQESKDGLSEAEYSFKVKKNELIQTFNKYKIELMSTPYQKFPFTFSNHTFACSYKVVEEDNQNPMDSIKSYQIFISRDNSNKKIIHESQDTTALALYICGYFKSPFEDRIAIIKAEERFVFEGSELFYSIVGCKLNLGK